VIDFRAFSFHPFPSHLQHFRCTHVSRFQTPILRHVILLQPLYSLHVKTFIYCFFFLWMHNTRCLLHFFIFHIPVTLTKACYLTVSLISSIPNDIEWFICLFFFLVETFCIIMFTLHYFLINGYQTYMYMCLVYVSSFKKGTY